MFIDSKHAQDIRRRLASATTLPIPEAVGQDTQISLPAALDLILLKRALRKQDTCAARSLRFFEPDGLSEIQHAVENGRPFRSKAPFTHRPLEAFVIRRLRDVQSDEWVLFR